MSTFEKNPSPYLIDEIFYRRPRPICCRTKPNRANLMFTVYSPPPHKLLEMFGCRIVGILNKNPYENWEKFVGNFVSPPIH